MGNHSFRLQPCVAWRFLEQQRQELPVGESQQQLAGQSQQQHWFPLGFRVQVTLRTKFRQIVGVYGCQRRA